MKLLLVFFPKAAKPIKWVRPGINLIWQGLLSAFGMIAETDFIRARPQVS